MNYLFLNDINYLFRKKFKLILSFVLIPIIFLLINLESTTDIIKIVQDSMGTNFNINAYSLSEIIAFMFSITISLFIIINIYSKDIDFCCDNIFLRMKPKDWYIKKSIFFLKLIQYLFVIGTLYLFNKKVIIIKLMKVFFCDYIYMLFIQFLFLFFYLFFATILKNKNLSIFVFVFLFILIPKNISKIPEIPFIIMIVIININNYLIFKFGSKKIIESI